MTDNKRTIKFEIKVDADAKGADRFNRALKELEAAAPIADRELKKVRQGILDFVQATGASERSTKAAENALRTLQGEAKAGGPLWKQIGRDIATLKKELGEATGAIRSAEQAQKSLNQALNAPVSNTFGKLAEQTGKLKTELQQLNYKTEDYLRTLTRVKELETVGSFNQGRLNTIAANQAFMGATLSRGYGASQNLPSLPDTLAGDSQRVSELTQRIQNLDRGSENYLQTVKELATAQAQLAASQAQLNRAVDGGAASYERVNAATQRRDAKLRAIAEYGASGNIADRRNDGFSDRPQAQQRGDGTFIAPPYRNGNYTRMGDVGLGQFGPETPQDFQRRVEPLVNAVESANEQVITAKRNAAVVRAEEEARIERRNQDRIDAIAAESIKREKARFDNEIAEFDQLLYGREQKRKQKLLAAEQRRRNLREFGGVATAVGVGGFFGGPEGGAGALIGGVLGGAGGAQAGATIGLGLASGRQFVAGMATQSSELEKLRIALRSVAGSQSEYEASIRAVNKANRELNIPLVEGTRSFTQLAASVKGAGGTVADAALAYQAVNSAIKATGGSTQDAEGALRAITQIFSKGKVSAEELRGQLGERLPGAVTLFAASLGKTGPELDKALEQGKVGLNDLMKFLLRLDKDFSQTARQIAASGNEAGVRLQLQWERTAVAIGKAFQPLGAEVQNTLAKFLKENEASLVKFAKVSAEAITGLIRTIEALGRGIDNLRGPLTKLRALGNLNLGFLLQDVFSGNGVIDANANFSPKQYASQLGGKAQTKDVLEARRDEVLASLKELEKRRSNIVIPFLTREDDALDAQIKRQKARLEVLRSMIGKAPTGDARLQPSQFPSLTGNDSDDKARKKAEAEAEQQRRIAEQLAAEQQRLREAQAQQEIRLADMVYRHKVDLDNRRYEHLRNLESLRAQAEIARLNPQARGVASMFEQFRQSRAQEADRIRALEQEVNAAKQEVATARKMAAVTALAPSVVAVGVARSPSGLIARTGSTGDSTGPHLDARWADGRRIVAADADRYLRVNGRAPSSFGVTSGYGPRNLFGRTFHEGIDFGTPSGSGITLQNGAQLLRDLGFTGAGGYAVEIDTPQGRMRLLHLQKGSAASSPSLRRTPAGVASQERRNTVDTGDVAAASLRVQQTTEALQQAKQQEAANAQAEWNKLVAESTQQLRDNTLATQDNLQQLQDRTRLTLEGFKPEQIEGMVQVNQLQREETRIMAQLGAEQAKAIAANDTARLQEINNLITERANAYNANVAALQQYTAAQVQANDAIRQFEANRSLIQGIGSTLFNGINSAITSIVSGTKEWGQALREIASNVLADIGQQLLRTGLMRLLGGITFGGFPLFGGAFAEGGRPPLGRVSIVGEKGPELFVPDTAGTIVPNYKLAAALAPEAMPQTAMGPIDVKVSTTVINGVEYATVDQLRAATRQAAERGQAMALNRLQRSTKTRKRVGV